VIFNFSLQSGELPNIWRSATVTPVFKKGSPNDPKNYRPISLTCIPCKLLECGIKDALLQHLLTHNVISSHQHGFLSKKLTTTQLLECSYDWSVALTLGLNVDVAYLDYAKAFDSVVHSKLLAKLSHYGASGSVLIWIEKFLINRCQCVRVGNVLSEYADVVSGVV